MAPTPLENLGESPKTPILGESGVAEEKSCSCSGGVARRILVLVPRTCFYEPVTGLVSIWLHLWTPVLDVKM